MRNTKNLHNALLRGDTWMYRALYLSTLLEKYDHAARKILKLDKESIKSLMEKEGLKIE